MITNLKDRLKRHLELTSEWNREGKDIRCCNFEIGVKKIIDVITLLVECECKFVIYEDTVTNKFLYKGTYFYIDIDDDNFIEIMATTKI